MSARKRWFWLLSLGLLATSATLLQAKVRIEAQAQPLQIASDNYVARVDPDGCLSSLRAHGQEFLAANVSISRGSYFYRNGPLQLGDVSRRGPDVVVAEGERTSIEYRFAEEEMTWQLANHGDEPLVFFIVFAAEVAAIRADDGELMTAPITADAHRLACLRGEARLTVEGLTRVWGPWEGRHQVGQVDLQPDQTKELILHVGQATPAERREIVQLAATPQDPSLVILSPRPYQVFQRRTPRAGTILVSGRCPAQADQLELRIIGDSLDGALPGEWLPLATTSVLRQFNASLPLPAGGWYALTVRAKQAGQVVAEHSVDNFGVGEVFVGAGQSNSTNSGEFKMQQHSDRVASFDGERWQLADDPQPGAADRSQGGSFWPRFGDVMFEKYRVPIGVAVTGFGGTSVSQWQPGGDLFRWMMTRVHQLGPRGFRALLWHQGESDVHLPTDEYYTKLRNVIVAARAQAGWEFPWFVAQASYHSPQQLRFDAVRHAQRRLWENKVALRGPDTDTLTGDHRDLGGQGIHFSPKGLTAHGDMWAERVGAYLDDVLGSDRQ